MTARRAVTRHWLLALLLSAGLTLRVMTQAAYQPALVYIDSDRYLRGLDALDPLGYLAMLWPLQRAGGLAAVAAAQHLLGLGMACAIYAMLLGRGLWRWAAAVTVAPVLLDAYQVQAEQVIMPDVMFEALLVAGVIGLLWRPQPAAWQVAAAGACLGVAADVREVGEVLILPALAFVLVRAVGWRRLAEGGLLAAGFGFPLLAYMSVQFAVNGQFETTQRGGYVFYGRVATAANCGSLRLPADERALCPPRQVVDALGIDALVGDPAGPLLSYRPPPGQTIGQMADHFELAVLAQQPGAVTRAVDRDFVKLFALTRDQVPGDPPITRWQFQLTYPTYPALITPQYVARIQPGGSPPRVIEPLAAALRGYQLHGGYTPGPVLAIAGVASLAGFCALIGPRKAHTTPAVACLLTAAAVIAVLLVSDAVEFSWRYQLPAVILLPPSGMLGSAAIAARMRFELAEWRGGGREQFQEPSDRHITKQPSDYRLVTK